MVRVDSAGTQARATSWACAPTEQKHAAKRIGRPGCGSGTPPLLCCAWVQHRAQPPGRPLFPTSATAQAAAARAAAKRRRRRQLSAPRPRGPLGCRWPPPCAPTHAAAPRAEGAAPGCSRPRRACLVGGLGSSTPGRPSCARPTYAAICGSVAGHQAGCARPAGWAALPVTRSRQRDLRGVADAQRDRARRESARLGAGRGQTSRPARRTNARLDSEPHHVDFQVSGQAHQPRPYMQAPIQTKLQYATWHWVRHGGPAPLQKILSCQPS